MTRLGTLQEKREEIPKIAARRGAFNMRVFGSGHRPLIRERAMAEAKLL